MTLTTAVTLPTKGKVGKSSKTNASDVPVSKLSRTNIIGLPPGLGGPVESIQENLMLASMAVAHITPAWPRSTGIEGNAMHLFSLDHGQGIKKWEKVIRDALPGNNIIIDGATFNITPPSESRGITLAYLNEGSITESFTQDFAEASLEGAANFGSQKLQELKYITGSQTGEETLKKLGDRLGESGIIGKALGEIASLAGSGVGAAEGYLQKSGLGNLLSGSRIDFPAVWKGSSFQTGYSITVRLYNPVAGSVSSYVRSIIQPLIYILALGTSIQDEDASGDTMSTYNAPVLVSVNCPGLWQLRAGFVSSIEVVKGGEANDLSFKQRPNCIDVRISFGQLYNVLTNRNSKEPDRPTLQKYIYNLCGEADMQKKIFGDTYLLGDETQTALIMHTPAAPPPNADQIAARVQHNKQEVQQQLDGSGEDQVTAQNTSLALGALGGVNYLA